MAGNSPRLSPESKRRFAESLDILLDSTTGRDKLKDFLGLRGLYGDLSTLVLWEMCNNLLARLSRQSAAENCEQAAIIVEFAEDEDVNLDLGEMRSLRAKLNSGKVDELVLEAREYCVKLLNDGYKKFCVSVLLKE